MKYIIACAFLVLALNSCKKEENTVIEPLPAGSTLASGSFISSVHPTTGTAKIIQDSANKLKLVLEHFNADSGPDLRIWFSSDINATDYVEAAVLTSFSGNFTFTLPAQLNYSVKKNVLIWCEDFSVLFGYATLQ